MTTVPGTYFTKEQLEADVKVDKVSDGGFSGSDRMNEIGYVYQTEKKQYDKALAWFLLASRENNSRAQRNVGTFYRDGLAAPQNYLCALKWYLKAAEGNDIDNTPNHIGWLFENGYGVPLDKYKALEWYCHRGDKSYINTLKNEGFHRSATDKKKSLQRLIKETEYILEAEKEKLEGKQDKTQEQIDALVDVEITYKLVDGGKNGWKYVPILLADDKQRYEKLVNNSIANNYNEILELKQQIHLLKQEEIDFQLQIRERDRQITLLTGDFQHQKNTSGRKIASLQSENQGLKHKIDEYEQQIHAKDNKTNLLEKKHCTSSVQRTQTLDALEQEKQTIGQDKRSTVNEMERLKASYTTLEQLLKAKEDTIVLLNRENKMLSTLNQGNQQEANGMAETIRNLLKGKNNEIDLLKQNMEHALDKEKEKIKKLLKEIKQLKQNQHQQIVSFQEASSSSSTTVPEPSASNTGTNEDDTNNDFNYDTECGTEYSSSGDVSSEDGDHANDLNYDNDA